LAAGTGADEGGTPPLGGWWMASEGLTVDDLHYAGREDQSGSLSRGSRGLFTDLSVLAA